MNVHSDKIHWIFILWTLASLLVISCDFTSSGHGRRKLRKEANLKQNNAETIARTNIEHGGTNNFESRKNNLRSTSKRQDVRTVPGILSRRVEDLLMDEIKRSDQAANRAEVAYNIPKEREYFDTSFKAGDNTDIDTANMIGYNEKKGAYLPVLAGLGEAKDDRQKKLTEQFGNITGLPDFLVKHTSRNSHDKSNVSLIETVANTLQPSSSAFTSGIKELLEETKVEQSLKKGIDAVPTLEHSITPDYRMLPAPLDKTAINSVPFSQGVPMSEGYATPISPDEVFDEAVSPPEQLLDELSAGKFKHPLPDSVLNRMSNWNANKEYLFDNGYLGQSRPEPINRPHLSRVSTDVVPVHDFYLKNSPVIPTNGIPKAMYSMLGKDPEVLGRNQEFLNGNQFHSISDLDAVGPPVYPASVVHMPHHRPIHVALPSKHVVAHFDGGNQYEDVDEGVHRWHHRARHHHPHIIEETEEEPEHKEEDYLPHPKARSARCSFKPCFNGGKCTALIDRYVCTCREGFTGVNCEKRSLCYPNPCRHGTCSSNPENFVCTCTVGWQGKRCDERDKCHPNPCMHGGTCTSTSSGVYCSCPPGYKGKYCETEAKCSPLNPCVNGGRCQEMAFNYICICKNGFAGRNCDDVLNPTSIPPTVPVKPVPPQAIPVPVDQPPFLLEELNSLSEGPLQAHPIPVMKFDTTTVSEDHRHHDHPTDRESIHLDAEFHHDDHHYDDIHHDDHHYDDIHHDDRPQPISAPANLIIHTGDPTKEPKDKPKTDKKKKKKPPTDFANDDRYQTHLVSAGVIKGKPADEEKTKENPEMKKPPLEKPDQQKPKPTEKEENRPKQLVPTAEILKRLQNPHPVENQVYKGKPENLFANEIGHLVGAETMNSRAMAKNKVLKGGKLKIAPKIPKQLKTKFLLPNKLNRPVNAVQSRGQQKTRDSHMAKPVKPVAELICPGFCTAFCDKWCSQVGCCKQVEIHGPTSASNFAYEKYQSKSIKGKKNCLFCSDNADCIKGHCKCKRGFIGDGLSCAIDPCLMCDEHATCKSKKCECNVGYLGDGYTCKKFTDHCSRCSLFADCISNYCLCKPGYYGNGNDCWPMTDPTL